MVELIATAVITASSILLFGYWFRYTCILILSAKTTRDYAASVAMANQLGFLEVQSQLAQSAPQLDRLRDSLDRDYSVLVYLLKHAPSSSSGQDSLEKHMLAINYRMMRTWYNVSRRFSPSAAYRAIEEMSQVVTHFANAMGERSSATAAA
jgi:hypothetical protein